MLPVDYANFTYTANPCANNVPVPAVMRRGNFSYFDKKMGAGFDLHVASVTRGSLQEGKRHAVVVIACDFPVGGTAAAYLFEERAGTAVRLGEIANANWGPDWGRGPDSIRVRFAGGALNVEQCKDNDCTLLRETTYVLRAGKLTLIRSSARRRTHADNSRLAPLTHTLGREHPP